MRDVFEGIGFVADADRVNVVDCLKGLVVEFVAVHSDVGTSTTCQESPAIGTTLQLVCPEQSVFAGHEQAVAAG